LIAAIRGYWKQSITCLLFPDRSEEILSLYLKLPLEYEIIHTTGKVLDYNIPEFMRKPAAAHE
jgi:hypothetical protein